MTNAPDRGPHYVQSLARGLSVIRAFDARTPEMTLSDVARSTGLTRAAARRFLLTLVDLGYVRFDGNMFKLAPRVLSLGYAYLSSLPLAGIDVPRILWTGLQPLRSRLGTTQGTALDGSTDVPNL